jgi:hypothetical protein
MNRYTSQATMRSTTHGHLDRYTSQATMRSRQVVFTFITGIQYILRNLTHTVKEVVILNSEALPGCELQVILSLGFLKL